MNIYIASVAVVLSTTGDEELLNTQHLPYPVLAETIEAAAEQIKQFAFERWNPSDGWRAHQAVIVPMSAEFYENAVGVYQGGGFDLSEDGQTFYFSSDVQATEILM